MKRQSDPSVALGCAFVVLVVLVVAGFAYCVGAHAATCKRITGGNLQSGLNAAGKGADVCLDGTFTTSSTIRPLHGQTIRGGTLRYSGSYRVCQGCALEDGFDLHAGNITLDGVTVTGFEGKGVICGPYATIRNSTLTWNRQNAIGCIAQGQDWFVRIIGNTMTHNGSKTLEYNTAAAVKLMEMSRPGHALGAGGLVEDNVISDNIGNGIWWDRSSSAGIARGNTTNGNTHNGLRCEKCAGPFLFEHNTSKGNTFSGLALRNSAMVTARDNTIAGNREALYITYAVKDSKRYPNLGDVTEGYHPYEITIRDTGMMSGKVVGCSIAKVDCTR